MKKRSMWIQLVVSFFIVSILLLSIIGISYYRITSKAIGDIIENSTKNSIEQGSGFVSSYIGKLRQTTESLSHSKSLRNYLSTESNSDEVKAIESMRNIISADSDLVSATLVSKSGHILSTDENIEMKTSDDMMREDWYKNAVNQSEMLPVLVPAHLKKLSSDSNKWVISIAQEVEDYEGKNLGVLRIDISYDTISKYLDKLDLGKGGFTFIINDDHEFVYHPSKEVYTSIEEMDRMKPFIEVRDGYTKNRMQYVYQNKIPDSQWTLVGVSSLNRLRDIKREVFMTLAMYSLISLLVCSVVILFILRLWIKPIKSLQDVILRVGNGEKNLRADENGAVEIHDLSKQFNLMMDKIDSLMTEVKENERSIREYELNALASQINPHFLYNTLDTIVWMSEFNDSEKVVDITKSLARYFRISLNKGNEQISIKDEIDHVRQYLFIQKQRYLDKLSYEIKEVEEYGNILIPKLVLQPIVENAIYHGIKEVKRKGKILIYEKVQEDYLVIGIRDNGAGFYSEKKGSNIIKSNGVGLKNVDQRLRLQFGDRYRMEIDSEIDLFTEVRIFIPIEIEI